MIYINSEADLEIRKWRFRRWISSQMGLEHAFHKPRSPNVDHLTVPPLLIQLEREDFSCSQNLRLSPRLLNASELWDAFDSVHNTRLGDEAGL